MVVTVRVPAKGSNGHRIEGDIDVAVGAHSQRRLAGVGLREVLGHLDLGEDERRQAGILEVNALGGALGSHFLGAIGKRRRSAWFRGALGLSPWPLDLRSERKTE